MGIDDQLTGPQDLRIWELFHENSKTSRFDNPPTTEAVRAEMAQMLESLDYSACPATSLPAVPNLSAPIGSVLTSRVTARNLQSETVSLETLAALLHYSCGRTRDNEGTGFPRPFRVTPSGGALYPLEVYLHTTHVEGLPSGLHHYSPDRDELQVVRGGDHSRTLAGCLVQRELALAASVLVMITAIFERSTFKYGERGYRFVLLEAGHVAQNINLVAHSLGLGCVNIGGFFDRRVDEFLEIDGVNHSSIYLVAIGRDDDQAHRASAGNRRGLGQT